MTDYTQGYGFNDPLGKDMEKAREAYQKKIWKIIIEDIKQLPDEVIKALVVMLQESVSVD